MTAQTILPANTLSSGYDVANSYMFGGNANTAITNTTPTNTKIFTISLWIKFHEFPTSSGDRIIYGYYSADNTQAYLYLRNDFTLGFYEVDGGTSKIDFRTTQFFRDPAAWYHIVVAIDTSQGTDTNRFKLYINGSQVSAFNANSYPDQNYASMLNENSLAFNVGGTEFSSSKINASICEFVFIDGSQLAPTSFGEFDEDSPTIWKPKSVSSLTFGNNGSYLEFKATGTSANSSGAGADTSGNDRHHSVTNLAATDQRTDTCTNNFATLNALATGLDATLSEGNLKMVSGTATTRSGTASSIGLTAGKWFAEFKITGSANGIVGIAGTTQNRTATDDDDIGNYPGRTQQGYGYLSGGSVYNDSSAVTGSFATFTTDDIIGVAVDLDGDLLYFYKNGAIQNSGTGIDISGITPHSGNWFFAVGDGSGSTASTVECNFGNPITALSSAVADGKGFGSFEFTPKSGHLALCTKNLGSTGG